jgi:hypothetical protein
MVDFKLTKYSKSKVETEIKKCNSLGHFQQVAYSVHGDGLTQICFVCEKVRTSIKQFY